jgi:adenine specific DNA methylase Mod
VSGNSLYFGDNLEILRNEIQSDSVDLIYLDPPFNSKGNYNLLFRTPKGHEPHAQITAFEDTWHWGEQAEREFAELVLQRNTNVSEMMQALRRFLKENDMMAYLTMMANRLLELHRVLRPTGSLYLHCDPTASHYLKMVLDSIFGPVNFRNEVTWLRSRNPKGSQHQARRYSPDTDIILFFAKSDQAALYSDRIKVPLTAEELLIKYDRKDEKGSFTDGPVIRSPSMGDRHNLVYEYKGYTPGTFGWRVEPDKLREIDERGDLGWTSNGQPYRKLRPETDKGNPIGNCWTDISLVNPQAAERLGYPTQKPLQLLERIITASSNEGETILDPFCGCGTAIHAAEKLKRKWIGIDITHLAISLVESRLRAAFPGINFQVHGTPKDFDSARDLAYRDKYQFQWWACSLVNAQPYQGKKKGADSGIDGVIYFKDDKTMPKKIVVSVKAGENVGVPMIRDLGHVINRETASLGLFVTLTKPTAPMRQEAVKAGYYVNPMGVPVPKIQILTVEGLLAGTEQPQYFDLMQGGLMSRKPEREVDAIQLGFDSAAYLTPVQTTEEPSRKDTRVARAAKPRKLTKKTA